MSYSTSRPSLIGWKSAGKIVLGGAIIILVGCKQTSEQNPPADPTRSEVINGIKVYYQDIRTAEDLQRSRGEALSFIYSHGWTKDSATSFGIGSHYPTPTTTLAESRAAILQKFGKTNLHRYDSSLVVLGIVKSWADLPNSSSQRPSPNQ